MSRTGPVTTDTTTVQLGLAQMRVGSSSSNINSIVNVLTSSDSIGAMANTKYTGDTSWAELKSGFPLKLDYSVVIEEDAMLDCAFKEVTPYNMALAHGIDPTGGGYALAHSGEVAIGGRTAPAYVRMEAFYTYPSGTDYMVIIFPRAQVKASVELDLQTEEFAASPTQFVSNSADDQVSGGSSVWNDKPLGRIYWYSN